LDAELWPAFRYCGLQTPQSSAQWDWAQTKKEFQTVPQPPHFCVQLLGGFFSTHSSMQLQFWSPKQLRIWLQQLPLMQVTHLSS